MDRGPVAAWRRSQGYVPGAAAASLACALCFLFLAGSALAATETHVFEPVRSLTGGCGTSARDPVPDPNCPEGPNPGTFWFPGAVTTDSHGDIFAASLLHGSNKGGWIDVFDPAGHYLTQISFPAEFGTEKYARPGRLAVDSKGVLYAGAGNGGAYTLIYAPTTYKPASGEIAYPSTPTSSLDLGGNNVAIDRSNDHVLIVEGPYSHSLDGITGIREFGSFAEGNPKLRKLPEPSLLRTDGGFAVDGATGEMFVGDWVESGPEVETSAVKVFDHEGVLKETIKGVETPSGFREFGSAFGDVLLAVDEETGHLFIGDLEAPPPAIFELNAAREYVSTLKHSFEYAINQMALDNSGASANHGYLFVPSGTESGGHLYAFNPKPPTGPPVVGGEKASAVSGVSGTLEADVTPHGLPTGYHFEYVSAASFDHDVEELGPGHGFDHATSAGAGSMPSGQAAVHVSAAITGLAPGTEYRFRAVAANACETAPPGEECVTDGSTASFATYRQPAVGGGACPNEALRVGLSAALPDCRAYELVSPPETNSQVPQAPGAGSGPWFAFPPASADGDSVTFLTLGGPIGEVGGTGGFWGDPYLATRGPAGWQSAYVGPEATQTANSFPGAFTADHGYSLLTTDQGTESEGSLVLEEKETNYLRHPDGEYELIGHGSLGVDPEADPSLVTDGGTHVIFRSAARLEPAAPPAGTFALYDRTADGTTHVVSLLPGEVTPPANEDAFGLGASADGTVIAFGIHTLPTTPLYLRVGDAETREVTGPGATFAGLSENGGLLFYLRAGDLYRYDVASAQTQQLTTAGGVTPVNVSADGQVAYFVSTAVINPGEQSSQHAEAQAGKQNLYVWRGGVIRFVGTVTDLDVEGSRVTPANPFSHALGRWAEVSGLKGDVADDPSRTTADGNAFLFESRAKLTGYDPEGHREVYRYDAATDELACLTCNPTGAVAGSDSELMSPANLQLFTDPEGPANRYSVIPNLSPDGTRAVFQTLEPLVPADTDGTMDVYEWEAEGVGRCADPAGCTFLISSGISPEGSYLFGLSASGDDVFFRTTDQLLASDTEATASIYDARVGGGFPGSTAGAAECLGEACQPPVEAPIEATPASSGYQGAGNVKPGGDKHRVHHHKKKHHKRAKGKKGRGSR